MSIHRIDLTGEWEFRNFNTFENCEETVLSKIPNWMKATVPGTVHSDLIAMDIIPDPFFRDNELKVQWVGEADWEYRRTFHVDDKFLSQKNIQLVCEGLDTLATIFINGNEIASVRNMFITHRFDVNDYLCEGENEILILFDSPLQYSRKMEETHGKLTNTRHSHRVYLRKAQYSFGWDWGPMLPTSGIWRPIYIESSNLLRLKDVFVRTVTVSENEAILDVEISADKISRETIRYRTEINGGIDPILKEVESADDHFRFQVIVINPKLWWPNGSGEPFLYNICITAFLEDNLVDKRIFKYGIRTVELQLNDEGEGCFRIHVNGQPIFCKGADWIPADSFIPRIQEKTYDKLLRMTADASMNMLRIWGGGIYEHPYFYQLCDELGIMIWHDFMFACGAYPEDNGFLDLINEEAESVLRQLRNHASIVLWCGNNENEWIYYRNGNGNPDRMTGFKIFHKLLPEICQRLDPTRPYWPSSPWGGEDPNSEEVGNRHSWDIWSRWVDFTNVINDKGKFISEFGFQAPANISTWETCLAPEDKFPQSRIFEFHNKQEEGNERLFRFLAAHQKVTTEFMPFIYACQVNQAEALKMCIEHWRRKKFKTAGALIWQLNDCWPVSSWSLIDSNKSPKASYYYAKRFFSDILLSFELGAEGLILWTVNDLLHVVEGLLDVTVSTFDGDVKWSYQQDLVMQSNTSTPISILDVKKYHQLLDQTSFIRAKFQNEIGQISENCYLNDRYKFLDLDVIHISARVEQSHKESEGTFKLESQRFLKSVFLHLHGWDFTENFFNVYSFYRIENCVILFIYKIKN